MRKMEKIDRKYTHRSSESEKRQSTPVRKTKKFRKKARKDQSRKYAKGTEKSKEGDPIFI
jgi:hypothetical protein